MVTIDVNYDNHAFDPYLNQMYLNQFSGSAGFNPLNRIAVSGVRF